MAPTQKRQSRCMRRQYGPGSGSPSSPLCPSGLCLFPVICSPFAQRIAVRRSCRIEIMSEPDAGGVVIFARSGWRWKSDWSGSRRKCPVVTEAEIDDRTAENGDAVGDEDGQMRLLN